MCANSRLAKFSYDFDHKAAIFIAALVGIVAAIVVVVVWQLLNDRARERIDSVIDYSGRVAELLINEDINNRILSLDRLAQRWNAAGGTPRPVWEADAAGYLEDMPGFQAIEWADADLRIRWVLPFTGSTAERSLFKGQPESVRLALKVARERREMTLSKPFELPEGGVAIAAFTPVERDQKFDGVIVGVLHLEAWLGDVFARLKHMEHNVYVFVEGREVYRNDPARRSIDSDWTSRHDFRVRGMSWSTVVTPTKEFVSAVHAHASTLNLIVGLLISALIAAVVYLAITSRLRGQQLQSTAGQLASLLQNLPGMAYRCVNQPDWPMGFVSEGCERLSGHSRSDFQEQRVLWGELIHPQDSDRVWRSVQQSVEANKTVDIEYRITTKNKEERWVWERGRIVPSEHNHGVYLEGLIIDISDRKRAEIALLEARKFSEAVIETAAEAVITTDVEGEVETINRASQQMFGYPLAELKGKTFHLLITPECWEKFDQYIRAHTQEETSEKRIGNGIEVSARRKNGLIFPIHLSISNVRFNPVQKFVVLIRDISKQRAAEIEARQHREHLAHVDRLNMLGEMAAGIAHEINQPLTTISLFAQTGARLYESKKYDRIPEIFDKLSQHALRAGAVIERMQTMAQQRESTKEMVDCNLLVDEIVKLAQAEAHIRGVGISVETASGLPKVAVDVVQIQQVVLNLLRNGMEAMQEINYRGGNTIRLQTRLVDSGDIEVVVIDSGCGVSEEAAKNMFTPFATTKKSGLGLGLSICRAIIAAHGGQLVFHNNPLGGATFLFTLPVVGSGDQDG